MSYLFYRRIKGPVFLLTFGVTALLAQWHILGFGRSWPLYLIVYGVMRLIEGAVLATSIPALTTPTVPGGSAFSTPPYGSPDYGTPGYSSQDYVVPATMSTPSTGLTTIAPASIQTTEEKS